MSELSHNLSTILAALEGRDDEKSLQAVECVKNLQDRDDKNFVNTLKLVNAIISAGGLIRTVNITLGTCLKKGMAHSRKDLEALVLTIAQKSKEWFNQPVCKEHINSNKRLFDLVRYMRRELHEANLINDSEYHYLCAEAEFATDPEKGGSPSPRRLEDYDDIRERMGKMKTALEACFANALYLANEDNYLEPEFDPCSLGSQIRDIAKKVLQPA